MNILLYIVLSVSQTDSHETSNSIIPDAHSGYPGNSDHLNRRKLQNREIFSESEFESAQSNGFGEKDTKAWGSDQENKNTLVGESEQKKRDKTIGENSQEIKNTLVGESEQKKRDKTIGENSQEIKNTLAEVSNQEIKNTLAEVSNQEFISFSNADQELEVETFPFVLVNSSGIPFISIEIKSTDTNLNLSKCDLTEIPEFVLRSMKHLEELDLSENPDLDFSTGFGYLRYSVKSLNLSGTFPTAKDLKKIFEKFVNLEELNLSDIPNLKLPKKCYGCFKLKKLNLSRTGLKFKDLKKLKNLLNLETLIFDNNDLSDIENGKFPNFKNKLKHLSIAGCKLNFNGLMSLTRLNLEYLDISRNCFQKHRYEDELKEEFDNTKKWESLKKILSKSKFLFKRMNSDLENVDRPTKYSMLLQRFLQLFSQAKVSQDYSLNWLAKSDIDGEIDIGSLKNLKTLKIEGCGLTSLNLFYFIKNFTELESLSISGNNFSPIGENNNFSLIGKIFQNMKKLKHVNASSCNIDRFSFRVFGKIPNLETLILESNNLLEIQANNEDEVNNNSQVDAELENFKNVEELNVEFCEIREDELRYLSRIFINLKILKVSGNYFKNEIGFSEEWINSIEVLIIESSIHSNEVIREITNFKKLRKLNVMKNGYNLFTISEIGTLGKSLKKLFTDNNFKDSRGIEFNFETLEKLENLEKLVMRDFQIENELGLPNNLANFKVPNLKKIVLVDSRICDKFLFHLIKNGKLISFKSYWTVITDFISNETMQKMKNVTKFFSYAGHINKENTKELMKRINCRRFEAGVRY